MLRLRNGFVALAIAGSTIAGCAAPEHSAVQVAAPGPPWRAVDANTGKIVDSPGLIALASDFPNSASVQRRLLSAGLREKDATVLLAALNRLEAMGYALSPSAFEALEPVIGAAAAQGARARSAALAKPAGASIPFAVIPQRHRLVESVAWDARRKQLYVSTVVDRRLVTIADKLEAVIDVGGGSLFGTAIDGQRRLLWVGSGVVEQTPSPQTAFRGLIAVDLDAPAVVRRVAAPEGASVGDVAVAADGTVYGSDPTGGGLYRLRTGADAMEALVPPGTLRSPQGIAVHPGGGRIYVSDYTYGIAIVDLVTGTVERLAAVGPMMLDGTDGLFWFDGGLVAIQNGTNPLRIVRIALDEGGKLATGMEVIEASNPEWGEPTNGQIVGNQLIYVSDPQWERFGSDGEVKGTEPLRPNRIRITNLTNVAGRLPVR